MFRAALGYTQDNAVHLRQLALVAARTKNAIMGPCLPLYGQTYTVDFIVQGLREEVMVRTAWIVEEDTDFPRLTTCYVTE